MRRSLTAALIAAMMLSGCAPTAREPDNLALVRALGVDGAGPVTLTGVCGGANQQDISRGSCQDESFGQARARLPWSAPQELALTSVGYLVVGADVDLEAVLFAVLEDRELGASATVWLSVTGAAAVLDACEDPATDLELLLRQGVQAPTAARALAQLCTQGEVILPTVGAEAGRLQMRGEELWRKKQ